jgi:TolB-like protein/Flp pilus assembly protein TadD
MGSIGTPLMTASSPAPACRFGRFELQPAAQRLLVDGVAATLGPRAFDVLVALVERAGQLVSKAELLDRVWPGVVVEENNLQVQVSALRKILGPDAIATIPGRGYRFTLPLEPAGGVPAPASAAARPGPGGAGAPSIAVLPFVNISDDAANEYFADGLSEELLDVLSKIRGLRVTSRTSAFSFKGAKADIPTVGHKLNVATILEGSVRKAGSRVRITAQLVHVATDSHLWSQTYDRELADIFAVQDDIAHCVVKELRATLMGERGGAPEAPQVAAEVRMAVKGRSANAESYRLHLQGSFFLNRHNAEDMAKAIGYFRRALDLDPEYAAAWASLSSCYLYQGANGWAPFAEGAERARDAARRALDLAPDLASAHWALGNVHLYYDWDWKAAESCVRRALRMAPDDSLLNVRAAILLANLGRHDEAAALAARALALDPLSVEAHVASGCALGTAGRLAEAEAEYRKAIELGPQHAKLHFYLCENLLLQEKSDEALREAEREVDATFRLAGTALAELARGRAAASDAVLRELIRTHADVAAYQVAQVQAKRGDGERAFEWLERAYAQRDAGLPSMKVDVFLRGLHGDPRWGRLLAKMRLAD